MKCSTILLSFHSNTCTNVLRLNRNQRYALSCVPICVACRRTTYFSRSREYSFEKNGISVTNPTTAAAAITRGIAGGRSTSSTMPLFTDQTQCRRRSHRHRHLHGRINIIIVSTRLNILGRMEEEKTKTMSQKPQR